jgi:hypothetical protein
MDSRFVANELLAEFGKLLTVDGLRLGEEDNSCVLLFDGDLALTIEYDDSQERLVFSVYLQMLPKEPPEGLLRELLAANLYWIGTGGATLCLEGSTGAIILLYASRVAELDGARFERVVENLLAIAERWRERIVEHGTGVVTREDDGATLPSALKEVPPIYG